MPPFALEYLHRGHAVHFRCHHPDAEGIRIDVLSELRGVPSFEELWKRRVKAEIAALVSCDLVALQDLILTKKTQRDKDWPMIRRLVEAHYVQHRKNPRVEDIALWFREARTPSLLIQLAREYPEILPEAKTQRPLLRSAEGAHESALADAITEEEKKEREADRRYWTPLRAELEEMRRDPNLRARRTEF